MRVVAVDWSGAARGARKSIWLAEVDAAGVRRLECGRNRGEIVDELITEASRDPELIAGLDFAFSLPRWYLEERGLETVRDLWAAMAVEGESILRDPRPPFWRTTYAESRLREGADLRRTDREVVARGSSRPQSVFKLVGAGHVGTGSIRGMAELDRLAGAGFSVWPFDEPALPMLVEIYPRALTGGVVKSDARARRRYLARFPDVGSEHLHDAAADDNAFDALVSALAMWQRREQLVALGREPEYALEGRIWAPGAV